MDARTIRLARHLRHAHHRDGGAPVCAFDAFTTEQPANPTGADDFRQSHPSRLDNSFTDGSRSRIPADNAEGKRLWVRSMDSLSARSR